MEKQVLAVAARHAISAKQEVVKHEDAFIKAKIISKRATHQVKKLELAEKTREYSLKIDEMRPSIDAEWGQPNFSWSQRVNTILTTIFKFNAFRPNQLAAINATLSLKDVILVLGTGRGKSLVYQIPTLINSGVTIYCTPTLASIEGQVKRLGKIGIKTAKLDRETKPQIVKKIYTDLASPRCGLKVLYVTPDCIFTSLTLLRHLSACYKKFRINRIVIDQVHCASSASHEFRYFFSQLSRIRYIFPDIPVLGLTATATKEVVTDVVETLRLQQALVIIGEISRPNLYLEVALKPTSYTATVDKIVRFITQHYANEIGIIYVTIIQESIDLARALRIRNVPVAPYHSQLKPVTARQIYNKWVKKTYRAIIVTVACRMGIDAPNVRFVIHIGIPTSMEALYQQTGRGGHDGKWATCTVMYSLDDYIRKLNKNRQAAETERVNQVLSYCLSFQRCRAIMMAQHLDPTFSVQTPCQMCDNCTRVQHTLTNYNLRLICEQVRGLISEKALQGEHLPFQSLMVLLSERGIQGAPWFDRATADLALGWLVMHNFLILEPREESHEEKNPFVRTWNDPADVIVATYHGFGRQDEHDEGVGPQAFREEHVQRRGPPAAQQDDLDEDFLYTHCLFRLDDQEGDAAAMNGFEEQLRVATFRERSRSKVQIIEISY